MGWRGGRGGGYSNDRIWNFYHNNNLESSNVTVDWYNVNDENVNDENVNDDADDNEDLIDEGEARLWIHLESSSS